MLVEVLICTTVQRVQRVRDILPPPLPDVAYLLSCQGEPQEGLLQDFLDRRNDIRLVWADGTGLSRNRNFAFANARGRYLVLADDDNPLFGKTLEHIAQDFEEHPHWALIQYRMQGSGKPFPPSYVSSCELALRAEVAVRVSFDERFGLGSPHLACGEEEVFVFQASQLGYGVGAMDRFLCRIEGRTTGSRFLSDMRVQRSKGAVFALVYGTWWAYIKCIREALGCFCKQGANPLPMLKEMFWGIRYMHL